MKKPFERRADAPLSYRLNGHIALSASTLPGGVGWHERQPKSKCRPDGSRTVCFDQ